MTQIIVINFGSQVAHLINRRIRELGVHSDLVPFNISAKKIKKLSPKGIILSGGPASVYDKNSPQIDKKIFKLNIPVLGICYGMQLIGRYYGEVLPGKLREYGKKQISLKKNGILLKNLKKKEQIWMSHGDLVKSLPKDFEILAKTDTCPIAATENNKRKIYGLQFHPEVVHTPKGKQILRNFVFDVCKSKKDWNIRNLDVKLIDEIKQEVGDKAVIMGTSGGVDSSVAAALIHKAIGKKLHCVFIDHGLIRKGEAKGVMQRYKKNLKFENLYFIDASKMFLKRLENVSDPEKKEKNNWPYLYRCFREETKAT